MSHSVTSIEQHFMIIAFSCLINVHRFISELAPRVFYKLRNLKTLDLSKNHLQFLSGAVFADVPNLESLICESCGVFQVKYL